MPEPAIAPSAEDTVTGWLPPHTHPARTGGGLLAAEVTTTWTWTTPAGSWAVTLVRPLLGAASLAVAGPVGAWRFGYPDTGGLRRLHGVLIALEAIPSDAAAAAMVADHG